MKNSLNLSDVTRAVCLPALVGGVLLLASGVAQAETIGLVLTTWHNSGTFTDDAKECAHGINPDARENFRAQFKTKEEQDEAMRNRAALEIE